MTAHNHFCLTADKWWQACVMLSIRLVPISRLISWSTRTDSHKITKWGNNYLWESLLDVTFHSPSGATIRAGSRARSWSEQRGKNFLRHEDLTSHPRSDHPQDYFPFLLHTNYISLAIRVCGFGPCSQTCPRLVASCWSTVFNRLFLLHVALFLGNLVSLCFLCQKPAQITEFCAGSESYCTTRWVWSARRRPRHAPQQQAFLSCTNPCF